MSLARQHLATRHMADAAQEHTAAPLVDAVDRMIVAALARDARATLKELAELTGLSTSAVHARAERLARSGVIRGSRAVLNHPALGLPISAFITVTARTTPLDELAEHVGGFAEVVSCYTVAGDDSLVLLVRTASVEALDGLRHELITGTDATTHTSLVLHTHFEDRAPLPDAQQ